MQEQNQNPEETKIEIPEMSIKIGKDYIETDDYMLFLGSEVIDELMQWLRNTDKSEENKRHTLLYLSKAFALLRPHSRAKIRRMITELEDYKFILEEYINTIFENVYE